MVNDRTVARRIGRRRLRQLDRQTLGVQFTGTWQALGVEKGDTILVEEPQLEAFGGRARWFKLRAKGYDLQGETLISLGAVDAPPEAILLTGRVGLRLPRIVQLVGALGLRGIKFLTGGLAVAFGTTLDLIGGVGLLAVAPTTLTLVGGVWVDVFTAATDDLPLFGEAG
jgi:hypothetical protein